MSMVAAMAPNFEIFLIARIFAGLGAGAESVIIAPFLSEFIPRSAAAGSLEPWPGSSPSASWLRH
jgi:MFS family permease